MTNPKASEKKFKELFEQLSYSRSYSEVFGDFLEYALLVLNINKEAKDFAQLEAKYTNEKEHRTFAEMLFLWSDASFEFNDALGDLFMECVSFGRNGQFFTPQPICDMMSQITMQGELKDGSSVLDPACGSGRTLLSAARINRNLKFFGSDNDINCVKMATLNLLINTMEGEIAHMDTLSMQHFGSYHVRKILSGTHYIPYYYKTGAGHTRFIERYKATIESNAGTIEPKEVPILLNKKNQATLLFE